MPQSLIEAMARKKIVIASNNPGNKELIRDRKTGYLFKTGDEMNLARKIDEALNKKRELMKNKARKSVERFSWIRTIKKIKNLITPQDKSV